MSDGYFKEAWSLYEKAFPKEERRSINDQKKIFKNKKYHFEVIVDKELFVGLLFWWEFRDLRFVEYFATSEKVRNKGFGQRILYEFINRSVKPIVLEVELPSSEIRQRRIGFYERIGFHLNPHNYEIPPMEEGGEALELLIMSFPNEISQGEVDNFSQQYHPILFET